MSARCAGAHLKPNIFGTAAISKKILENKTAGMLAIKPSRIACK